MNGPPQFSLHLLFVLTTLCAILSALLYYFGPAAYFVTILVVGICLVWASLFYAAPQATKYLSLFFILGLCLLSLIPPWLLESRLQARRNLAVYHLTTVGTDYQQQRNAFPRVPEDNLKYLPLLPPVDVVEARPAQKFSDYFPPAVEEIP